MNDDDAPARPEPFSAYTTPEFWDDAHISQRMLDHHLDPDSSLASRSHAFIDDSVAWIANSLNLRAGSRVPDLGSGPGLYAARLGALGIAVTCVDVSARSLAHAAGVADKLNLPIATVHDSYLDPTLDLGDGYDAALLIYEDYCAMSPAQRALLLARVREALRPGGHVLFDVTSDARFDVVAQQRTEAENLMNGFWASEPYTGVHETFTYPDLRLVLDRYTIRSRAGTRVFWNWMQCLKPEEVRKELAAAGFGDVELFGDVAGSTYDADSPTFAVRASR